MNICMQAALASNEFERANSELKREYLIKNINVINAVMSRVPGYCGSFGTGYPFYVLDFKLEGELPIIEEQIRYNDELLEAAKKLDSGWRCESCLNTCSQSMPDLKQICKPCPQMHDDLKPRKVINRLPDIDMWMICLDPYVDIAKDKLARIFDTLDMRTSDVDPIQTIKDITEISNDLSNGTMPTKMLPLDIHIIKYSKISSLISEIPYVINDAIRYNQKPYLPIHPISLRKTWQFDDEAYNFVLDYMYSLTPFSWKKNLNNKLETSRTIISELFSDEELNDILRSVSPDSVTRRLKTKQLQNVYQRRINSWVK